jgi:hypothetical protein
VTGLPKAKILGGGSGYVWPPTTKRGPFTFPAPTPRQTAAVWIQDTSIPNPPDPFKVAIPTDPGLLGYRTGQKDPLWFRERFNGIEVPDPGYPFCPGNYPQTPTLMQTWFTPWLLTQPNGATWLDRYIQIYMGEYGLTHARLSVPQAMNMGVPDAMLFDCAAAWASNGAYVCLNVFGGDGPTVDDPQTVFPRVDRMVKSLTWVNSCWQQDKWFDQEDTDSGLCPLDGVNLQLALALYASRHGLYTSTHWMRDGAWWGDALDSPRAPYSTATRYGISDRFNWQAAFGSPDGPSPNGGSWIDNYVTYLGTDNPNASPFYRYGAANDYRELSGRKVQHAHLMQYDTNACLNGIQEALASVFRSTAPHGILVVLEECEAQDQSDQRNFPPRLPVCGDMKGRAGAAAVGYGQTTSGYGDGGYDGLTDSFL